jgi:hypothetical protein
MKPWETHKTRNYKELLGGGLRAGCVLVLIANKLDRERLRNLRGETETETVRNSKVLVDFEVRTWIPKKVASLPRPRPRFRPRFSNLSFHLQLCGKLAFRENWVYTVRKGYRFSCPQPGCHLPNSPWPGMILLFPARESLVSDIPAGDGKIITLFLQCIISGTGFLPSVCLVPAGLFCFFGFSVCGVFWRLSTLLLGGF